MFKKIVILAAVVLILTLLIYQIFFKEEKENFELFQVVKGNITQEVSATGQVEKGDKIYLSFKTAGKIEEIFVKTGDELKKGEILAKIDTANLSIQLNDAKAALAVDEANLAKLIAGPSQEEIKVSQAKVNDKQVALDVAKQNLNDAYEDGLDGLDDNYLKAYNAKNFIDLLQRTYFTKNDQPSLSVISNQREIEAKVNDIKSFLDAAKNNPAHSQIDSSLAQVKSDLSKISDALKIVRDACEDTAYKNSISTTDKTSLDTYRTNIYTEITDVITSQQTISAKDLAVDSAETQLQIVKNDLAFLIAPARQVDIDLYRAKVDQAKAQVQLLENQIKESYLLSPVAGQLAEIKKRVGEIVQPTPQDVVAVILPSAAFEIKVDIYEEDIVSIKVGNLVDIKITAFPEKIFKGEVISIDPAEKLVEEVVYYSVAIGFAEPPEGLKSGMTSDVEIKTLQKDNVLVIPESAISEKDGKTIVKIEKGKNLEEKEIQIGLKSSGDMVEVVSGLNEGETIVVPKQ